MLNYSIRNITGLYPVPFMNHSFIYVALWQDVKKGKPCNALNKQLNTTELTHLYFGELNLDMTINKLFSWT